MNAITLYQPYASLCVLPGADGRPIKQYETRSWKRDSLLGQRIAIHAGANRSHCDRFENREALKALLACKVPIPGGAIVGSAVVKAFWRASGDGYLHQPGLTRGIESQSPFGDFSPGRWAWELADVERLVTPIPAKGQQGVWKLTAELVSAYNAAEKVKVGW